jgi:hypothetical protein
MKKEEEELGRGKSAGDASPLSFFFLLVWFESCGRRVTLPERRAGSVSDRRNMRRRGLRPPVADAPGSPFVTRK